MYTLLNNMRRNLSTSPLEIIIIIFSAQGISDTEEKLVIIIIG